MHELVVRSGTVVDGTGAPAFTADLAIDDGQIVAVGRVSDRGRRELDADGLIVAPGWVDIHTHYDGQAMWDSEMAPSSWHGATTVVMGNCGVGFAPVRSGGEDFLVELMESVEDIPDIVLHEGLDWSWESYPEYLNVLESRHRTVDVASQVPHIALRAYVMGDRAHEDLATPADIDDMHRLAVEALEAGACGISTSRTVLHQSTHGLVPGTHASEEEILALGDAIQHAGHGVFQLTSDNKGNEVDRDWMVSFADRTNTTLTYLLSQAPLKPTAYQDSLAYASQDLVAGRKIRPQVGCRPTGMLFGLQSSLHPFITHDTWKALEHLPHAQRVAELRRPEIRRRLLAEARDSEDRRIKELVRRGSWERWDQLFPLGEWIDYEPEPDDSIAAIAAKNGRPSQEVALDAMLEADGTALLFAPMSNYAEGNHDAILEMMQHPQTVLGLSDAGAHCAVISDASMTTYMLTHWVRDRNRGERLSLEEAVRLQAADTAAAWGFEDRGQLLPGKRADINLIDLDGLALKAPEMAFDLPAGGKRLIQGAQGYVATVVSGEVTYENGDPTGAHPGRLVRFGV